MSFNTNLYSMVSCVHRIACYDPSDPTTKFISSSDNSIPEIIHEFLQFFCRIEEIPSIRSLCHLIEVLFQLHPVLPQDGVFHRPPQTLPL
ncbi:hypothetical protein OIU79_001216 [Salix purpurea]|uniref:Uncharacterized protein n=1 Tax=Salix purpurea TaxID=77065 RepID=A0A9Q0ZNW3_SALPP|nr:hypothetical protein OIU79_001216 [Salix purpurea]